jgi:short-subunit dehydrogenase
MIRFVRRRLVDCRALVTGASSGIGRALAIELARQGVDLVLLARREDRLEDVAKQISELQRRAILIAGDVTDAVVRRRALDAAREQLGGLDILVNNAGVAAHGRFADADPGRLRPIMEVNFFAPVELMREAIPLLRAGTRPIVVNIGSILGRRGSPHKSEYSASKFALHGFSEAVRPELARLGIDVLVVAAGPTETEHFDVLLEGTPELPWGDPPRMPADKVARSVVRAIERNRHEITTGWRGRLLLAANRLFPGIVDRIMARYG